jgi:hypothetical protein
MLHLWCVSSHIIVFWTPEALLFLGRFSSVCMHPYNIPQSCIDDGPFAASINSYVQGLYDTSKAAAASSLVKALKLRDGLRVLPHARSVVTERR